jgi:hypothetical protein
MAGSPGVRRRLLTVVALPVLLSSWFLAATPATAHAAIVRDSCSGSGNSANSCYPPSKPRSSVSATRIEEGQSVTYCVDGYHGSADVALTEKKDPVATIHTDGDGHGCVQLTPSAGCHHYSATGPDPSGQPVTTSATVCVDANSTGQAGGGGHVKGGRSSSGLPFTGAVIVPFVAVGAGLLLAGILAVRSGRRRRHSA